jgi:hypothetical protein
MLSLESMPILNKNMEEGFLDTLNHQTLFAFEFLPPSVYSWEYYQRWMLNTRLQPAIIIYINAHFPQLLKCNELSWRIII